MGLKTFNTTFVELSKDSYIRIDEKYYSFIVSSGWNLFNSKNKLIPLKDILIDDYTLFRYEEDEEYKGVPTGQSHIDKDGEIKKFQLVTKDNHPNRLKYKISNHNILISSLRLARSPALFFESKDLSKYVFSNAFFIFKVNEKWNEKFILYTLRSKKIKNILDYHIYRGIGISAYKKEDLLKIKIPFLSRKKQDRIILNVEKIENKIKFLKSQIISPEGIINEIFSKEFKFNLDKVNEVENIKYFSIQCNFTYRNNNLRSSVRWNKIKPIQNELYKNYPNIEKLGKYLISTKNGWSPNCRESDTANCVFSLNSISKDGIVKFDDLKYSDDTKNNIEEFFVNENDLFVSRGNTVDLVALASIVKNLPTEQNFIFPDLFIKITVDEKKLSKEFLAFLFNSVVGRYYFKYSAKGKNQTMVKISKDELNNFYIPVPKIDTQHRIVNEIKAELRKQKTIKEEMSIERNAIDNIIEKALI